MQKLRACLRCKRATNGGLWCQACSHKARVRGYKLAKQAQAAAAKKEDPDADKTGESLTQLRDQDSVPDQD